jgi:hypothetical protein
VTGLLHPSGLRPAGLLPVPLSVQTRSKEGWYELGWPGLEPRTPSLDIVDFDDSGSITSPNGNDPVGGRFAEATRALKVVRGWTYTSKPKVAVLHFDHLAGATGVMPLISVSAPARLSAALRVPWGAVGSSDLSPSLTAAEALAAAHPGHDVRLTVFSDFELTDTRPEVVYERLRNFPGHVHAVVLNGEPPEELEAENITVTQIASGDPAGSVAAALHRSLTATRRGARTSLLRPSQKPGVQR